MKKFSKRQLVDQIGLSLEDAQLVLDYQNQLPVIIENDGLSGFCVNARDLWQQLQQPQGSFSNWVSRKFEKCGFEENVDFKPTQNGVALTTGIAGINPAKDYLITIQMAKEISMMEKSPIGKLVRKYFLLMENVFQENLKWTMIRDPLRKKYNDLKEAINAYLQRTIQRDADKWDYIIEADALNVIATGFKAQEIRGYVRCQDNVTRDSLTAIYNEYLLKLEELDIIFLGMNMNRYERYKMLSDAFDISFPNAVPLRKDATTKRIRENKEKMLSEVKEKQEGGDSV